ncbi:MAG: Gfo/Idh/MocA family oxidoreductase [Lentisphaeria bacterium]|nr:Gfo/Idh/MocA family oxidoreductase [Lentisphaeria bacterium]
MKKFRFVLVGSGNIASTYVRAAANVPTIEITGCVSRSGKRPQGMDSSIPVYPGISDVTGEYDAVILATPNGCHAAGCLEAAEAGKHVFTEKTLALTRSDMDKMIRTCREKNLKLAVAFQRRTAPDNIAVRELLQNGTLGKVIACELNVNFWRDSSYYSSSPYRGTLDMDGGGPFVQQASHNIDLYVWFFGLPEKVHALTGRFLHPLEGEDYGVAICRHADGMIGTITASTASKPGFDAVMTIRTSKGSLVLQGDKITFWQIDGVENPCKEPVKELHSGAATNAVTSTLGHEILLRDFAEKAVNGGEVFISGEEARKASELILQIYEAAKESL